MFSQQTLVRVFVSIIKGHINEQASVYVWMGGGLGAVTRTLCYAVFIDYYDRQRFAYT